MKIMMIIAVLMLAAGIVLNDVILGALGFCSLASAASFLLAQRFTLYRG